MVWDRELPRLRRELEAARQAGVTQALLGHIGQLPLARSFGLTPRGDFGLGLTNGEPAAELAAVVEITVTRNTGGAAQADQALEVWPELTEQIEATTELDRGGGPAASQVVEIYPEGGG